MLGHEVTKRYAGAGLPDDTIDLTMTGSAGQSFGAFVPRGITLRLEGDANDYLGKGLSGGRIIVRPDRAATFKAEEQIIAGNVIAYGATAGEIFIRGGVGERFCVRNSGATAVVEGVGDHGCEYMTGGRAVVLGPTGRNFAAGMSGGYAFVLDLDEGRVNPELVELGPVAGETAEELRDLVRRHHEETGSAVAEGLLADWPAALARFTEVMPSDYKRVLEAKAEAVRGRPRRDPGRGADHGGVAWLTPRASSPTAARSPSGVRSRSACTTGTRSTPADPGRALLPIIKTQAGRCMDCGIPFCHQGCPLGNIIPEWNDLVWRGDWDGAMDRLHATNNFPEFTGRLCPAPCETACVLGINSYGGPVTIKNVEVAIIDRAWESGYVRPQPPEWLSGKTVAVIGSGPAGLAAAQQLTRAGHTVAVYERADKIGGLLRYGIPEFKMEKAVLDKRLDQMRREGTVFRAGVNVGEDLTADQLTDRYDAIVLAIGATVPRDLAAPGRELGGIHQAMEYLPQSNRASLGTEVDDQITAEGKHVVIIGGGDTGADCLGTATRQGASSHHPARDPARTPGDAARGPALADLPDDLPGLLGPRGGRRAGRAEPGLRRVDAGVPRRRVGQRARAAAGRGGVRGRPTGRGRGHRAGDPRRPGAAGDGLHQPADRGPGRAARLRARRAGQRTPRRVVRDRRSTASSWPATAVAVSR